MVRAMGNFKMAMERKVGPNQAAAEESHWVVSGSTKNDVIYRERVVHDYNPQSDIGTSSGRRRPMHSDELHQDPPVHDDMDSDEESVEEAPSEDDAGDPIPTSPFAMCIGEETPRDSMHFIFYFFSIFLL